MCLPLSEERSLEIRLIDDSGEMVAIPTEVRDSVQARMIELEKVFLQLPGFGTKAGIDVGRHPTLGWWENLRHQCSARGIADNH